ncbi:ATP-binding protein [Beijerinckia sp. L45]|uniref:ATP-binding protein n=1 Tax=Beijerinckia sp. L45 TaxID=1641855 RepID=UPI00131E43DD|nr:ATP-binding protein [Beijerinckia sp. L45]
MRRQAASSCYRPAAIACALDVVRRAVSEDAAAAFAAVIALRPKGDGPRAIALLAFGEAAGFGSEPEAVWERLLDLDRQFLLSTELNFLAPEAEEDPYGLWPAMGRAAADAASTTRPRPESFLLSDTMIDLLDEPHRGPARRDPPVPDAMSALWISTVRAAAKSGRGVHLALRVRGTDGRETDAFAGLVAADGRRVDYLPAISAVSALIPIVLRAELHADDDAHVVVVAGEAMFRQSWSDEAPDDDDAAKDARSWQIASQAAASLGWLGRLRHVYVWSAPAKGFMPHDLDGIVGACIGPFATDPAWNERVVADAIPGLRAVGTAALLRQLVDPREVAAMAAVARAAVQGAGIGLDEACRIVARSFGDRPGGLDALPPLPPAYDARLLVADHDVGLLNERAAELARNAARVLFWGPPGGGKSAAAQMLARMSGRPMMMVRPAAILAHRWGDMERRLEALWRQAAGEGATLVVDELDSLCGRRGSDDSANGVLVRTLTDEWLRALDAFPSVCVIATVNDLSAIDDAVRRRFAFVVGVSDTLTADRERLAWDLILGVEPPSGWIAVGAAVADFALAASRCRMLGLNDAASLADAVVRARAARLGILSTDPVKGRGEPLH